MCGPTYRRALQRRYRETVFSAETDGYQQLGIGLRQLVLENLESGVVQTGGGLDDLPGHPDLQQAFYDFHLTFYPALHFAFGLTFGQQLLRVRHNLASLLKSTSRFTLPEPLFHFRAECRGIHNEPPSMTVARLGESYLSVHAASLLFAVFNAFLYKDV